MTHQLEGEIRAALAETAQQVRVPPASLPGGEIDAPAEGPRSRRTLMPVLAASAAILAVIAGTTWAITAMEGTNGPGPTPSPPPMGSTSPGPAESQGGESEAPALAYGRGDSLVIDGGVVRLGEAVVGLDSAGDVTVARTSDGQIWEYSGFRGRATAIGRDAVVGPVLSMGSGVAMWVEDADEGGVVVVQSLAPRSAPSRVPLPAAAECCESGAVLGMEQHMTAFFGNEQGVWTVHLGEGSERDPEWTPVSGLGGSRLERVDAEELIVRGTNGGMGWGNVDPGASAYSETGRTTFTDLWFLSYGVVATTQGRLAVVDSTVETNMDPDGVVRPTHRLGDVKFELDLPMNSRVHGVTPEQDRAFLVDVTLADGDRGWYRCTLTRPTCELATVLKPDDVTPGSVDRAAT